MFANWVWVNVLYLSQRPALESTPADPLHGTNLGRRSLLRFLSLRRRRGRSKRIEKENGEGEQPSPSRRTESSPTTGSSQRPLSLWRNRIRCRTLSLRSRESGTTPPPPPMEPFSVPSRIARRFSDSNGGNLFKNKIHPDFSRDFVI